MTDNSQYLVEENDRRDRYLVTNPSGQDVFDIGFPIDSADDLMVFVNGVEKTEGFTVDLEALTVTFDENASADDIIVLEGLGAKKREVYYPRRGGVDTRRLNGEFQRIYYMLQELDRDVKRCLRLNKSEGTSVDAFIELASANRVVHWNEDGSALINGPLLTEIETVSGSINYIDAVGQDLLNDNYIAILGEDLKADGNKYISTVGAQITKVVAAGENISAITGVFDQLAKVINVNDNATNINKVAAIDTSVVKVANVDSAVSIVATDIDLGSSSTLKICSDDLAGSNTIGAVAAKIDEIVALAAKLTQIQGVYDDIDKVVAAANDLALGASSLIKQVADDLGGDNTIGILAASINNVNDLSDVIDEMSSLADVITQMELLATNISYIIDVAQNAPKHVTVSGAPALTDDVTEGFSDRSEWLDSLTKKLYRCVDASEEAADWREIGLGNTGPSFQTADVTVTVGSGGDYSTVDEAIEYLKTLLPGYKNGGFKAEISLLTGFVWTEQLAFKNGVDLSWIEITSVDATVTVDGSEITVIDGDSVYGYQAAITVFNGAVGPVINTVFVADADTSYTFCEVAQNGKIHFADGAGASGMDYAIVVSNGGVISAGDDVDFSGCDVAITYRGNGPAFVYLGEDADLSDCSYASIEGYYAGTKFLYAKNIICGTSPRAIYAKYMDINLESNISADGYLNLFRGKLSCQVITCSYIFAQVSQIFCQTITTSSGVSYGIYLATSYLQAGDTVTCTGATGYGIRVMHSSLANIRTLAARKGGIDDSSDINILGGSRLSVNGLTSGGCNLTKLATTADGTFIAP